ncbi:hypothetical protein ATCC90586_003016 [Pythium insidiosum]|nr:hypothetical protein ATCC90586_003016 [Pythium insidiosum]
MPIPMDMAPSLTESLLTPPARDDRDCVLVALPERPAEDDAAGEADDEVHEPDELRAASDATHFNFERTFRFMTERRLQRRYRGVYKRYSFTTQLVTWIVVIYTLAVLATFAFKSDSDITSDEREVSLADSAFSVVLLVLVIYFIVQAALVIRWMVYWVIVAGMLQYAITGNLRAVFWLDPDSLTPEEKSARDIVATLLIAAEVLTILVFVFTHHVYPWCVLSNKFNTVRWWDVKPSTVDSNSFTYRSRARIYTKKRNSIRYCGGLDAEMRPHGYGMWTDSSYHGERLTGQWEHVECSVSGGFFRFLPAVRHLTPLSAHEQPHAQDFRDFLRSLVDAGYTTINIIGHSMGARIYFYALTKGYLDDVFEVITDPRRSSYSASAAAAVRKARLSTLIFANPDYERNEFRAMLDLAIARVNQEGMFEGVKGFAYNRKLRKIAADETEKNGTNPPVLIDMEEVDGEDDIEYLDMDVIDTTWMDNNVHAIRHNYFNLNPTVVDDIRSLIVTKQRASSRAGLLKSTSADNVYLFLVAPSHIKNK